MLEISLHIISIVERLSKGKETKKAYNVSNESENEPISW